MSPQLIHHAIDGLHIPGIDLVAGIAIRQMLDELIQGGLVVADGGGDGVDGFFARGGGGIGGGHVDQGWEDVQDNHLAIHQHPVYRPVERKGDDGHSLS